MSYTTNGSNNKVIAEINPFRYRGYYYDSETKLYYLNSRYYDPETGRFINADDISVLSEGKDFINGLNLYLYCGNNPVMNIDRSGYFFFSFLIASILIGAIVGGIINTVKAASQGVSGLGLVGAFLGGAFLGGAMGGILCLGGGAALGLAGGISLGTGLLLSAGIGIVAGWTSYSIEAAFRDDMQWNILDFGIAGVSGAFKGITTFGMGFIGGAVGAFDKMLLKPMLKGVETLDYSITYSFGKILLGRKVLVTPIAEFLFKLFAVSSVSAGFRTLIDFLFEKIKRC